MTTIDVRDLEEHTREILRQVANGETIEVVDAGKPVAKLVPPTNNPGADEKNYDEMSLDALIEELGKYWPEGVTAIEAINDVRRDI
jgi:prevent-host-death family protein